jgi:hypothetical protein
LVSAKPGRRNIKGEILWDVEMPAHPAPINTMTDPKAKHLKMERTFTGPNLRGLDGLGNLLLSA